MVKTLSDAKKNWARKTSDRRVAARWKAAIDAAVDANNYKKGIAAFLGVSEEEVGDVASIWADIMSEKTASDWLKGCEGKEDKYAAKLKAALTAKYRKAREE